MNDTSPGRRKVYKRCSEPSMDGFPFKPQRNALNQIDFLPTMDWCLKYRLY